jgi:hypothetical protein
MPTCRTCSTGRSARPAVATSQEETYFAYPDTRWPSSNNSCRPANFRGEPTYPSGKIALTRHRPLTPRHQLCDLVAGFDGRGGGERSTDGALIAQVCAALPAPGEGGPETTHERSFRSGGGIGR